MVRDPRGRSRSRPRPRPRSCDHCRWTGSWRRPAGRGRGPRRGRRPPQPGPSCAANTALLSSLTSWPAPRGPTWSTGSPNVSSTGRHRSTTSAGPPTITSSSRAVALWPPPLTGASRTWMFGWSCCSRRQVSGWTVLCTMTTEPSAIAARAPSGPRRTSSTPSSSTTQTPRTSDAAPSSAGRRRDRRRGVAEGLERSRAPGPERRGEAGVDDPSRHRPALAAEADEADAGRAVGAHDGSMPAARAAVTSRSSSRRPKVHPR